MRKLLVSCVFLGFYLCNRHMLTMQSSLLFRLEEISKSTNEGCLKAIAPFVCAHPRCAA